MNLLRLLTPLIILSLAGGVALAAPMPTDAELAARSRVVLRRALAESGGGTARLHAGEALALHGEAGLVRPIFLDALRQDGDTPQARIGLWRVLARCAATPADKQHWIGRIESSLDPAAPDWVGATESLSKLGCVLRGAPLEAVRRLVRTGPEPDVQFGLWAEVLAGDAAAAERIGRALDRPEVNARLRAGYILGWLRVDDPRLLRHLAQAADQESESSTAYPYVVGAAYAVQADPAQARAWRHELDQILKEGAPLARSEACRCLALRDREKALPKIIPLLDSPEIETRIGAAAAILSVVR